MMTHSMPLRKLRDMDMKPIISAALLAQVAAGKTLEEAFDMVFGPGIYQQLVYDLYKALREDK